MTTARHAASTAGDRQRSRREDRRVVREERRRMVREELLAVGFLVVALLVTVLLLALQWLHGGSSSLALAPLSSPGLFHQHPGISNQLEVAYQIVEVFFQGKHGFSSTTRLSRCSCKNRPGDLVS